MSVGIMLLRRAQSPLETPVQYSEYFVIILVASIIVLLVIVNWLLWKRVRGLCSQLQNQKMRQDAEMKDMAEIHVKAVESLAKLAASLSHDLNNTVGSIMGYASLLKLKLEPGTNEFHYADIIEKASKQVAELVRSALGFSQLDTKTVEVVDLVRFTRTIAEDFVGVRGKRYDVVVSAAAQPVPVRISTSQLRQVLLAVLDNAADSMETGGMIKCSINVLEASDAANNLLPLRKECLIEIEDHGTGMDEEIKKRIFEPFFTTKREKKNAGLSLSRAYSIVRQHSGSIIVDSSPGIGTKVEIFLPIHSEEETPISGEAILRTVGSEGAKILVVDDEENVRQLGSDILTDHGFQVVTANDGLDALEKLKENPDTRLVVMDMIMPVMSGKEACVEIKKMKYPPKVLISTGFSELADIKTVIGTYAEGMLQKPYNTGDLVSAVENLLKDSPAKI